MKHVFSFGFVAYTVAISGLRLAYLLQAWIAKSANNDVDTSSTTGAVVTQTVEKIHPQNNLLTILVDDLGDCPDNCEQVHTLLPTWVKFQYKYFSGKDILKADDPEQEGVTFHSLTGVTGHLLLVSKIHIATLGKQAEYHRKTFHASVGLFVMADELGHLQKHLQKFPGRYNSFDYILRNYWFPQEVFDPVPLRALGNMTCGSPDPKPPLPTTTGISSGAAADSSQIGPRWGLHWTFLLPHTASALLRRSDRSIWPTQLRPTNCSFHGWDGGKGDTDRKLVESLSKSPKYKDMGCSIKLFPKPKTGNRKFLYLTENIGQSKIVFNPRGIHPECHRLSETLIHGSVPAMKEEEYMKHVYKPIPGIIEPTWKRVFVQAKYHLENDALPSIGWNSTKRTHTNQTLAELSQEAAKWWTDLQECMRADMSIILTGAFGDYNNPNIMTA